MNIIAEPSRYSGVMPMLSAWVATVGPRMEPICAPATINPKFFLANFTSTEEFTRAQ